MFMKLCSLILAVSCVFALSFSSYAMPNLQYKEYTRPDHPYQEFTVKRLVDRLLEPGFHNDLDKPEGFMNKNVNPSITNYTINNFKYNTSKSYLPSVNDNEEATIAELSGGSVIVDSKYHVHSDSTGLYNIVNDKREAGCKASSSIRVISINKEAVKESTLTEVLGYPTDSIEFVDFFKRKVHADGSTLAVVDISYNCQIDKWIRPAYFIYDGTNDSRTISVVAMIGNFYVWNLVEIKLTEDEGSTRDFTLRVEELLGIAEEVLMTMEVPATQ